MQHTGLASSETSVGETSAVNDLVAAVGADAAMRLFMTFGASTVYVPKQPRPGSRLGESIGEPAVLALSRTFGGGHLKVPLANVWLARQLDAKGVSRADICRTLRVGRRSITAYLAPSPRPKPSVPAGGFAAVA